MTNHTTHFFETLQTTNRRLVDFVDWQKVYSNVDQLELHLCNLGFLLGKSDLSSAINVLFNNHPDCFNALPILLAVRDKIVYLDGDVCKSHSFESAADIVSFLNMTGLDVVFRKVTNLRDYVFGVEVGLDSNARKNRGGKTMESRIQEIIRSAPGFNDKFELQTQVRISSLGLGSIYKEALTNGADNKVLDFVLKKAGISYAIETNFYNSGGSKLNETSRSFQGLDKKIRESGLDCRFIWITDGNGWLSAKNQITPALTSMQYLFNLHQFGLFMRDFGESGT
jgi:type II restriction enzyme